MIYKVLTNNYNINDYSNNIREQYINENNSAAKELNILNVKSIYYSTLAKEFYNDSRFLIPIDHDHNTRRRAAGRFREGRFHNEYGRKTLDVTLPKIFNNLPNKNN